MRRRVCLVLWTRPDTLTLRHTADTPSGTPQAHTHTTPVLQTSSLPDHQTGAPYMRALGLCFMLGRSPLKNCKSDLDDQT